ncbi:MAG: 30S ribosomal protein S20 [Rhodospirillaceae bacterium]|nr:30S ribosomal protein S20 [Rhodospirillaceae bacterium]
MAHHASAKKRIRRNARRFEINHSRMGRIRTSVKKVEMAIAAGDQAAAKDAFKAAMPELMRGRSKGILHANTVSRKISRLNARIKAMPA